MRTLRQCTELSDDIIFEEILTRLPVQSVVRIKSVSKKWYSTLSSSDFATAHLNKSPFSRPCAPIHTLFIESIPLDDIPAYYLLPFDDNNHISGDFENDLVNLDVDFGDVEDDLYVTGSCNGLICLARQSIDYAYFYLWNPATRKLNKYDDGFIVSTPDLDELVACGFGYVSAVDDYKFVRITSMSQTDGPYPSTVHVFSCRRNKWTQLDFDLSAYLLCFRATLVNETLYWPRWSTSGDRIDAIISFDLEDEKFNIFHYPGSENGHLGIMGERLCMVTRGMIDILMPPTILKSITLPKDLQGYEIVGFTRDGKLLVSGEFNPASSALSSALYLVNTDTEPLECSKLMELEGFFSMFKYIPSLISPFLIETLNPNFSISELSDDIIFEEILSRLPVKSVVRFKSVSKKWYSTLSSSDFATAHLNKTPFSSPCAPIHTLFIASTPPDDNNHISTHIPAYYLLPFDDNNHISGDFENDLVKLDVDFGDVEDDLYVIGSCNGLICLAPVSIDYAYFFLWNPATRKLNKYDGFGYVSAVSTPDMVKHVGCGFGYVSAVDDYKFVRITSKKQIDGPYLTTVHVFSCKRNKWTQLDFDLNALFLGYRATLVNEKLYWRKWNLPGDKIGTIISFDLGPEKFNIFHYPGLETGHLGIMGERLCMVTRGMIDILMPPTILKSITLPKVPYVYEIVGFTRDGELLVLGDFIPWVSKALYLVNTDTELLECSKLMELERYSSMFKYIPSLISPFLIVDP